MTRPLRQLHQSAQVIDQLGHQSGAVLNAVDVMTAGMVDQLAILFGQDSRETVGDMQGYLHVMGKRVS